MSADISSNIPLYNCLLFKDFNCFTFKTDALNSLKFLPVIPSIICLPVSELILSAVMPALFNIVEYFPLSAAKLKPFQKSSSF